MADRLSHSVTILREGGWAAPTSICIAVR